MSAVISRSSHPWAASHRLLLALVAFAVALAASVAIAVATSAGSSPAGPLPLPTRVHPGAQNQGQPDDMNRTRTDIEKRCLQHVLVAC